jgi:photosystem II stability/assembly factor-like uncharacterized protein
MLSKRPFFTALVMLVCLLGAMNYAQNPPASPLTADDFNQFAWRWIGPMTFSGRITGFAVPRGQSTKYYVLTATSGVWKTEDAGISFEPIFEKGGTLSTGWLAIAPSDPNILYLGTGEPMHARSSTHGNGVWKSVDAGKTWTKIGLGKSYFINKVEVDSKNPDIVYVAAEGKLYDNEPDCERGLFKTTDGGKTWTNLGPMPDRGVADVVIDPRNSDIVITASYKLVRRAWTYIDRQPGNELYKSTDGGKTWKKLTSGLPQGVALGRTGLAMFEKNPAIVYARVDEEVNLGFPERDGVANFRVPAAGGPGGGGGGGFGGAANFRPDASFAALKTFKLDPLFVKASGIKFTPFPAEKEADFITKLNEAIADKDFLTKNAIDMAKFVPAARKAFARDEATMTALDELEKLTKKPAPAADSTEAKVRSQVTNRLVLETVYSGVLGSLQPQKRSGVVYRSDDQGETWKAMTEYRLTGGSTQVNQTEGGYYGRIIVDQNDDKVVYCGDTNTTVSKDSGKTFAVTGWDGTGKTHVDHRVVWVDPLNSSHLLSGNDGGVSESWNGGKNWSQKNGIRAQQFYDVSVDQQQPYNVMGGTQDNGAWIGPSQNRNSYGMFANDWKYLPTGDGFYVVRDWWNPEYIYYESQFGSSSRQNLNTGETSQLAVRLTPEQVSAGEPALRYQWNAPIVLSPHNPGIVYIANQYVWRSLSRGAPGTFQKISPDLTKANKEKIALSRKTNLQWATIYSFAESPKRPGLYWVGTDDGNVQVSTDSGATWTNITSQFYDAAGKAKPGLKGDIIPYDRWVKRVVPSAFDENTCYVAFSGYRTHNEDKTWLYVTKDLGKTWTDLSGGMNNPIFDLEEDPDNANVLYLGTDCGIWVSVDQGKTWAAFSTSQPTMVIRDLAIQKRDREMAIGTYARGFFVADIAPMKEFKPEVFEKPAHLFEPQAAVKWNRFDRRGETLGEMVRAINPPVGATIYYYLKADAQKVAITIKDLEGNTINEFTPTAKKGLQKAFWNLNRQAAPGSAPVAAGRGGRGAGGGAPDAAAPAGAPNPDQPPQAVPAAGGRGGRGGFQVDPGVFKVTLTVDGKEVESKRLTISPDPLFR